MLFAIEVFHCFVIEKTVSMNTTSDLLEGKSKKYHHTKAILTISRSFIRRFSRVRSCVKTTLAMTRGILNLLS